MIMLPADFKKHLLTIKFYPIRWRSFFLLIKNSNFTSCLESSKLLIWSHLFYYCSKKTKKTKSYLARPKSRIRSGLTSHLLSLVKSERLQGQEMLKTDKGTMWLPFLPRTHSSGPTDTYSFQVH